MDYTVFDTSADKPEGIVVPTVTDALAFARLLERKTDKPPIIAAADGWMLTVDELEELARS